MEKKSKYSNQGRLTHGGSRTPTYVSWQAMITRCTNPKQKAWADYGGRGIKVCDRWLHSFEQFRADMGERPPGMTLDRKDGNGHYEPGNCRWVGRKDQNRNKRDNKLVEHEGQTRTVAEWAEIKGMDQVVLNKRLRRGWPVHLALSLPEVVDGRRAMPTERQHRILALLSSGPMRISAIVASTGEARPHVDDSVARMKKSGFVERVSVGIYRITEAGTNALPLARNR